MIMNMLQLGVSPVEETEESRTSFSNDDNDPDTFRLRTLEFDR
jgi:hypothetical protein